MNEDDMKNNKEEKRKEVLKDKGESALAYGVIFGGVAGIILLFESSLHTTANESTAPFSLTKGTTMSTSGVGELATDFGPIGSTGAMTGLGCLTGTVRGEPVTLHVGDAEIFDSSGNIYTRNNTDVAKVERNAEQIYDTFNKNHERQESVSGLVVSNMEIAKKLEVILRSNDKKTLYEVLTGLQEVLEEKKIGEEQVIRLRLESKDNDK
jgi:hypothetical protein